MYLSLDGGAADSGDKQTVINSAAETVMKLMVKNQVSFFPSVHGARHKSNAKSCLIDERHDWRWQLKRHFLFARQVSLNFNQTLCHLFPP